MSPAPTTSPARRSQFWFTVYSNEALCREHFRLCLRLAGNAFPATHAGQFVQIECRDHIDPVQSANTDTHNPDTIAPVAFLRRPFSLAGRRDLPDGSCEIDIIHRVVGIGTAWLARLQPGDRVNVLGPLGNRFVIPPPDELAILVGGGVGIPPMLYLADHLAKTGRRAIAFCGATTRELLPLRVVGPVASSAQPSMCIEEFAHAGVPSVIATDDGSLGVKGFVTQALEPWLDRSTSPRATLYTCGPELMMKRVAAIAAARNMNVQVAVERAMACGMGTCQSCCIKVKADAPDGWRYQLTCTDGPIFPGDVLLW